MLKRCAEPRSSLQLEAEVQEGPEDRDNPQCVTPDPAPSRWVPLPECQCNSFGKKISAYSNETGGYVNKNKKIARIFFGFCSFTLYLILFLQLHLFILRNEFFQNSVE